MTDVVLAGGCFWCLEAVYDGLAGVVSVESGYAGGHLDNPTYDDICGGDTGHAEVLLLSALLWATPAHHDDLAGIVGLVRAEDFYVPAHGELFTIIAELIADGTRRAHDATTVAHELRRQGRAATLGAERPHLAEWRERGW